MKSRILVVDPSSLDRKLLRDILEFHDHQVAEASSLEEARGAFDGSPPNLILVGVLISDGDGENVLKSVRDCFPGVPVVAVTARAMQGDRERLLAAGFDGYFSTPINTRTFAGELEVFLTK